jgi:hypothetical protein
MTDHHNTGTTGVARSCDAEPLGRKPITPFLLLFHLSAFAVAFCIALSRRPDALLRPQFWAEDGTRWYTDAYQYGFHSAFVPSVGYYVTLQRLVALAVQWAPMQMAPLLFNLTALVLQILPVTLFLSKRYAFVRNLPFRIVLSLAYLGLPNSAEINGNLTNAQWHLALLGCMVLLARPGTMRIWVVFDFSVILLLALTGPFSILLLPIAAIVYWKTNRTWCAVLGGLLAAGAVIQIVALSRGTRVARAAGASFPQFIRITGHQVFMSALFGQKGLWLPGPDPGWHFAVLCLFVLAGTSVMTYAAIRGPWKLKLFVGFSAAVFAAALKSPLGSWQVLHLPGAAGRYWFFPMLGFLASLFWMAAACAAPNKIRFGAFLLALTMSTGVVRDWRYPPLADLHFSEYVERFAASPRGARFAIPINPGWTMVLVKK